MGHVLDPNAGVLALLPLQHNGLVHPQTHLVGDRPLLLWPLPTPSRVISSGPLGGGVGLRNWVINATVEPDYGRTDPAVHLGELAEALGVRGDGVGLLTAVDVGDAVTVEHAGVTATATTGVGHPTWAVQQVPAVGFEHEPYRAGTINIVVHCPVALTDAALVNLVGTVTEAKTQALLNYGVSGTGTATDTVTVLCPPSAPAESFGGVRSVWGARAARAVFDAVHAGLVTDRTRVTRAR